MVKNPRFDQYTVSYIEKIFVSIQMRSNTPISRSTILSEINSFNYFSNGNIEHSFFMGALGGGGGEGILVKGVIENRNVGAEVFIQPKSIVYRLQRHSLRYTIYCLYYVLICRLMFYRW